jgi:hypothetical protein
MTVHWDSLLLGFIFGFVCSLLIEVCFRAAGRCR